MRPADVVQRAWNSARHAFEPEYGRIPQAHEVQRQLADRHGRPFPWKDLLDLVFDPTRSVRQTHAERQSSEDRILGEAEIAYALTFAAARCGSPTLFRHDYEQCRESVIRDQGNAASTWLPTANQLEHAAGGWDAALEISGLHPRPDAAPPRPREGASPTIAIARFYAERGHLPHVMQVRAYCREANIALRDLREKPWKGWLAEALIEIEKRGLPTPSPYGAAPPPDWVPREIDVGDLPRRDSRVYTRLEVLRAVRAFHRWLPAGLTATQRRWQAFSRERPLIPSAAVISRHGGLASLIDEASQFDWCDRALTVDRERPQATRRGRHQRPPGKPTPRGIARRIAILQQVEQCGPVRAKTIAENFEISRVAVLKHIKILVKHGLVDGTEPDPRQKSKQSYVITPNGRNALSDEQALRVCLAERNGGSAT